MTAGSILVASDLAPRSDRVLDRATILAEQMDCELLLLHVHDGRDDAAEMPTRQRRIVEQDYRSESTRLTLRCERGKIADVVARTAREEDCRLIAAGPGTINSLSDRILGTNVDALVRTSPVPVLVVRRRPQRAYRRLLVLTDFSLNSHSALEAANDLFPNLPVDLVHVCGSEERAAAELEMAKWLSNVEEGLRGRVEAAVELGRIQEVIDSRFENDDYDLLIIGTRGLGSLARVAIGSTASSLLRSCISDVLVVRDSAPDPAS